MLKLSLPVGDDLLEIHHGMWSGKDTVRWNGEVVSQHQRFFGSRHRFTVFNPVRGQDDAFEVRIGLGWNGTTYAVRRNDRVLLGTWREHLTHEDRRLMPDPPAALDLNQPPPPRAADPAYPPRADWSEEDYV